MISVHKPTVDAIVRHQTADNAMLAYAMTGEGIPICGDTITKLSDARCRIEQAFKQVQDAIRPVWERIRATATMAVELAQQIAIDADPKAGARIRNGHPPFPRKQLLHNGRKPRK